MLYSTLALLLAGKLLTNALDPAMVGHFALLLLCAEFLGMLANLGLPTTLPKLLQSRGEGERGALLACLLSFQFVIALVLAGCCFVGVLFAPAWLPQVHSWLPLPPRLLALLPVLLVAVALRDFLLSATAGLHAYRQRAATIALMSSLQAIFFLGLFVDGVRAPLPFAVSHLLAMAGGVAMLGRSISRPRQFDGALALAQVRFSLPLFVNNLLNFLYQRADTLIVVYYLGIGTAALFEMAKRIPGVLSRFFGAALIPYLPSVSELLHRRENARAGQLLRRASIYTAFAGYTITLVTVALRDPLLQLLFTEDYTGAAPVLGPLLVAACLAVQAGLMGQALIALERPQVVMYVNVGMAAVSLAANLYLVPRFGLVGAGWSAVAAGLLSYVFQRLAVTRAGVITVFARGDLVHVFFGIAFALTVFFDGAPVIAMIAAAGFIALCFATRLISVAELRSLFRAEVTP